MTPEELFAKWAPADSIWSPWVIPVPFAHIASFDGGPEKSVGQIPELRGLACQKDLAVVVDLPGGDAIRFGLALGQAGFRPVAVLDGSPGPFNLASPANRTAVTTVGPAKETAVVDMRDLLFTLCAAAPLLQELSLTPGAPPAFLLDALRMKGSTAPNERLFDNRWKVFPQDFPSAKFLREHGIRRAVLLQERKAQPQEDLAHVLLRWQEAGLEILSAGITDETLVPIRVEKPSRYRAAWYRALEIFRLRRNSVGGFGGWPYEGASG